MINRPVLRRSKAFQAQIGMSLIAPPYLGHLVIVSNPTSDVIAVNNPILLSISASVCCFYRNRSRRETANKGMVPTHRLIPGRFSVIYKKQVMEIPRISAS